MLDSRSAQGHLKRAYSRGPKHRGLGGSGPKLVGDGGLGEDS